ncbi:ATP-binding domain-containing protein [Pseudomonas triticifolii]|uniref:DNA 3'-5' helicase II n=1 Tax=Pseudomonas triticifolii TaxID=2762592 RepID=A0ABR7BIW6_9PSED|nr:ATP-binding domain-containing protein [Pseudomonas triticifolii]MBC3957108.1 AAA family ATPase [Pseudomonas triticifolii]
MHQLADWCAGNYVQCYIIDKPLIEIKGSYDSDNCFAILIPKRKIVFVSSNGNDSDLSDYADDFVEDIGYISTKFNYKDKIGRPKRWQESLTSQQLHAEKLSIEQYLEASELTNAEEQRLSELLVSLATGSINDIERVGVDVPENDLDRIKRNILLFDGDQTRFVYQDLKQKEVRIQGLSGTGKTELLLHKLKELYVADDISRIAITCHNKILAANLRARIPKFFNFMKVEQQIEWNQRLLCVHAWGSSGQPYSGAYAAICSAYDIPCHPWSRSMDFDRACTLSLEALKAKGGTDGVYAFDYMLVDESQDFPESFFELCEIATKNSLFIAGDIFQSIFDERKGAGTKAEFTLSKCYRTAPTTLMFAQALAMGYFEDRKLNWLDNDDLDACGYQSSTDLNTGELILKREPISRFEDISQESRSVDLIRLNGEYRQQCCLRIIECIRDIKKQYSNVTANDVGIIMIDRSKSIYEMSDMLAQLIPREIGWPVNKAYESGNPSKDGELFLSNTNHVKGLEFPFVICVTSHLSESFNHRNALYMAITRSFLKTYFLVPNGIMNPTLDKIQAGLEKIAKDGVLRVMPPPASEQEQIRASVKWHGRLKSFDDLALDILSELGTSESQSVRYLSAMKSLLDPDASKAEIQKLARKLTSE